MYSAVISHAPEAGAAAQGDRPIRWSCVELPLARPRRAARPRAAAPPAGADGCTEAPPRRLLGRGARLGRPQASPRSGATGGAVPSWRATRFAQQVGMPAATLRSRDASASLRRKGRRRRTGSPARGIGWRCRAAAVAGPSHPLRFTASPGRTVLCLRGPLLPFELHHVLFEAARPIPARMAPGSLAAHRHGSGDDLLGTPPRRIPPFKRCPHGCKVAARRMSKPSALCT